MLNHVLPALSIPHSVYGARINSKLQGNDFCIARVDANFSDHVIGQFAKAISLSACCRAMQKLVVFILFSRAPSQIFEEIVKYVSIPVANLVCWCRLRADKRLGHHDVNCPHLGFVVLRQIYCWVSLKVSVSGSDFAFYGPRLDTFVIHFPLNGSNSTVARHFVEAFKIHYRAPFLNHRLTPFIGCSQYYQIRGKHV